jgi:hypothetical protein
MQIAGGSGEWGISRDVHRLGTHLDYFRLMAFYHSAVSGCIIVSVLDHA